MISIVVYGRNDIHGYNMHKRVALSLNCMAAVLTDPSDEILFVDFNTRDDFPTFPEAIRDTFTPEAREKLRILRVRPSLHAKYQSRTHLTVVEPVARNVAVRRSNPANRWILSTNSDMIFTPRGGRSLSDVTRDLPRGYYGIPRFELPESLWESLDRIEPQVVIPRVAEWGWKFHLNEIVFGTEVIKFDAPGDFQLVERDDLFNIHGFNEEMLRGWHVDSNLCKRLNFLHGGISDLSDAVYGYHCGHTRQMTLKHNPVKTEDSFADFVHMVTAPELPRQAETWGLAQEEIEEIRMDGKSAAFPGILAKIAGPALEKPIEAFYVDKTYDQVTYDPAHMLPFLADLFANVQRTATVAWVGGHARMFDLFREIRQTMGFTGSILICGRDADALGARGRAGVEVTDIAGMCSGADSFVFDCVRQDGGPIRTKGDVTDAGLTVHLTKTFRRVIDAEWARSAIGEPSRRVIAINAIHNRFEKYITLNLNGARAPFSTRLRHGTVAPFDARGHDWLALGLTGRAGLRKEKRIEAIPGVEGHVVFGPYLPVPAGMYRAAFGLEVEDPASAERTEWEREKLAVYLDVVSEAGKNLFGSLEIKEGELKSGVYSVAFEVMEEDEDMLCLAGMEARAWTSGACRFVVTSLNLERVIDPAAAKITARPRPQNWLAVVAAGRAGVRKGHRIETAPGVEGRVAFGPYLPLPRGRYRAVFGLDADERGMPPPGQGENGTRAVYLDVISEEGKNIFGSMEIKAGELKSGKYAVPFEITEEDVPRARRMEARVWTKGRYKFAVTSLNVERMDDA